MRVARCGLFSPATNAGGSEKSLVKVGTKCEGRVDTKGIKDLPFWTGPPCHRRTRVFQHGIGLAGTRVCWRPRTKGAPADGSVDTHSSSECVSTWARHRFGSECVSEISAILRQRRYLATTALSCDSGVIWLPRRRHPSQARGAPPVGGCVAVPVPAPQFPPPQAAGSGPGPL